MEYAYKSIQNSRDYQEDRFFIGNNNFCSLAFVADGHGGTEISEYLKQNLSKLLLETFTHPFSSNLVIADLLRTILINFNKKIIEKFKKAGSTFTGVLITNSTIFVINIGDSRTCCKLKPFTTINFLIPIFDEHGELVNKLKVCETCLDFFCTLDHTPESNIEQIRIKSSGGIIEFGRVNGILSVSRAFGDLDIQPGVSAVPDIYWFSKNDLKDTILMYSDGVYEPMKTINDPSFDPLFIYELANKKGPQSLIEYSLEKGSKDNITVVMIKI